MHANHKSDDQLQISVRNIYATLLVIADSLTILFDPIEIDPQAYRDVDIVIVTHEHIDHFDKGLIKRLHDESRCEVLTTPFVAKQLECLEWVIALKPGDFYNVKGVWIYAEQCEHAANDPLTFIIKTRHFSVFHPGDSDFFPQMGSIRDRYAPDIMIYMRCSEQNLRKISSAIKPRTIFCCEYPMMEEMTIPDVEVKRAKPLEWFVYPYKEER